LGRQAFKPEFELDTESTGRIGVMSQPVLARETSFDLAACLECALRSVTEGVIIADLSGRFVFFNPVAERILGIGAQDVAQQMWSIRYGCFLPDKVTPFPADRLPLARALRGEEACEEIFIRNLQRPGGVFINVTGKPLRNRRGELCGGVAIFKDVTVDRQSFETISLLSNALEQTDDTVIITNKDGVIEYVNPSVERRSGYKIDELLGKTPRVLKSGRQSPEYYRNLWATITAGEVFRSTLVNRKANGELYWIEQTITPMKQKDGRITHYVSVGKDVTEQRKRQEQEIQLKLARDVQQRLYPQRPMLIPGFDIAGQAYPAASTGGDYYDIIRMPEGNLCIAIGDVSGHGFDSALLMSTTRAYLRAFMQTDVDLAQIMKRINCSLVGDFDGGRFLTLSLTRIHPYSRSFVYANAGHLTGYLLDSRGKPRHLLESMDVPLAAFPARSFSASGEIAFESGDILVLLTDGITEARDGAGNEFGVERTLDTVCASLHRSAPDIVEDICSAVRNYIGDEPQLDDITCVICKVL
jgi:PAS domain S-box-containing protein